LYERRMYLLQQSMPIIDLVRMFGLIPLPRAINLFLSSES
jgi:hypothetical protein